MTDDDFLIEEVVDGMSASADEEEDLLADVQGSTMDRLQSWELDSQISQPPTSLPPQPTLELIPVETQDAGSGWDGTTEPVPPGLAQAAATAALGPGKGAPVLVVDPRAALGDSPVEAALTRLGFKPRVCQTGASTRDELASGRFRMVFLRLDNEPTWARMLVSTAIQRWPHLRFVASLPGVAHEHMAHLKKAGVADIVPDPLPDYSRMLLMLQRSDSSPPAASPASVMSSRLATPVLPTPVVAPAAARPEPVRPAPAPTPPAMNAGTADLVLTRVRAELVAAQRRAQELETQLAQAMADKAQNPPGGGDLASELKALLTAHPYGLAMDHALKQMAQAVEARQPLPAEELARNVKNLKAVRGVLRKMEERLGITAADHKR